MLHKGGPRKLGRMKCIGIYQFLVHADDISSFWSDINTIKRNTDTPIDTSKESDLKKPQEN